VSSAATASWPAATVGAPAALESDASSIQLVGSLGGSATQVQVVGTHAYVGGPDSLRIVDVSHPASPTVLGSYPFAVADVYVVGNVAYLAGTGGMQIVDVADAAHPVLRGSYDLPLLANPTSQTATYVQVTGDYAYVIFQESVIAIPPWHGDLAIVDVRDPAHPALRSRYNLGPSFSGLAVLDGYVYVGGTTDVGGATARFFNPYLSILDARDPLAPTPIGSYHGADLVNQSGGALAVADGVAWLGLVNEPTLRSFDAHDPASPTPIGSLAIKASDLRVVDQFAYVAEMNAGLAVVDIRNPAAPVRRASYGPLGRPSGVDVAGDLVYIASDTGLRIVRFLPRTTALIPAGGGTLDATVGRVSYQFPSGAFAGTAVVTHTLRIDGDVPPAPAHIRIGPAFEITAGYSATGLLAQPAVPITITVGYTDSERGSAVADTPALYYWDGSAWVKEHSSVLDQTARTVTAASKRLGVWALMGDPRRALLPILRR
jgi:hypothetical protein